MPRLIDEHRQERAPGGVPVGAEIKAEMWDSISQRSTDYLLRVGGKRQRRDRAV